MVYFVMKYGELAKGRSMEEKALLTQEEVRALADARAEQHEGKISCRPLSKDYELIGLVGEEAFALEFGMGTDHHRLTPHGDGRIDFHSPAGTIDVKTAEKAYNLLMERGKPHADILVLAKFNRGDTTATLLGWEYSSEMEKMPYKDFGYGIINHYKHNTQLRPIEELYSMIYPDGF